WQSNRTERPLPSGTCVAPMMPCPDRRSGWIPRRVRSIVVTRYRRMVITAAAGSCTRRTN
ncbi:MAG: LSU ribosomal protein L32p @ LSU ribosomal protein L32p, zinc-independent, partial [Olavius algarvensis Gamma 1 endosymbiont]